MIGGWTIGGHAIGGTVRTGTPTVVGSDVIEETFTILGASYNRKVATLTLGPPNFTKIPVPWRRYQRDKCPWNWADRFTVGSGCGFPSDAFEEDTRQSLAIGATTDSAEERRFGWWTLNALEADTFDVDISIPSALYIESTSTDIDWSTIDRGAPFFFKLITGDFEVSTKVNLEQLVEGAVAAIVCQDTTGSMDSWFLVGTGLSSASEIGVVGRAVEAGALLDGWSTTTDDKYIKLKRAGTTFTAYHSADGATWTTLGSDTVAIDNDTRIGLVLAKLINLTGVVSADFESFQFVSGGEADCDRTLATCSARDNAHRFGAFPGIPR